MSLSRDQKKVDTGSTATWMAIEQPTTECDRCRLPQFLVIGAQKSGTTWLWQVLRSHPELRLPAQKEVHFFDRMIFKETIQWYVDVVSGGDENRLVVGEVTPSYSILKRQSIQLIRDLMPDLRVILLLRRPEERAWSQARMEVSGYNKRELTKLDILRCIWHTGVLRNRRRSDYRRILENWLSVFPRQQLFVGFYDEIEQSPDALLERICKFIGVDAKACTGRSESAERVWRSPQMEMPRAVLWYLKRRYRSVCDFVASEFDTGAAWKNVPEYRDECRLGEKASVLFSAYLTTVPYNMFYSVYDFIRDVRMAPRIRRVRNEWWRQRASSQSAEDNHELNASTSPEHP